MHSTYAYRQHLVIGKYFILRKIRHRLNLYDYFLTYNQLSLAKIRLLTLTLRPVINLFNPPPSPHSRFFSVVNEIPKCCALPHVLRLGLADLTTRN